MGSPLSPIVADLFMEDFESTALASTQFSLRSGRGLLMTLASFGPMVLRSWIYLWTTVIPNPMEVEVYGSLPFLDILISRMNYGFVSHQVFAKKLIRNNTFMLALIVFLLKILVFSAPWLPRFWESLMKTT